MHVIGIHIIIHKLLTIVMILPKFRDHITSTANLNMSRVTGMAKVRGRKIREDTLEQRTHSEQLFASSTLPRELCLRTYT